MTLNSNFQRLTEISKLETTRMQYDQDAYLIGSDNQALICERSMLRLFSVSRLTDLT